jgi:MSHA biogenesis protein MshJ
MKLSPTLARQLAPWQARWERQAKRIDALSLRERVFLFLCIVAVLAAIFDTLVLSPQQARARQRTEAAQAQQLELKRLREQFVSTSQGSSAAPQAALKAELDQAQAARNELDATLAHHPAIQRDGSRSTDASVTAVLQRLLDQHPGLSLNRVAFIEPPPERASAAALPQVRWQGLELQVEGPYPMLARYLQALEKQLPGLQWGELRLSALGTEPTGAARLQAQLYVLRMPS